MKIINLIPQVIKDERRNKRIQKTLTVFSLVPIGLYSHGQYEIGQIKKDTSKFQESIAAATNIETDIRLIETEIFNNTRVVSGLSNEQFPLHRFLLFMSVSLPEDMRLYSVTSDNVEKTKKAKAKEVENNDEETGVPVVGEAPSTDIGGSIPTEIPTVEGAAKTPEQLAEEERLKKEEEQKNIEDMITSQKTVFIRGATLSINSLGVFMKDLENNDYISKVDIHEIENYYNGAQSYKIFELTVTLK